MPKNVKCYKKHLHRPKVFTTFARYFRENEPAMGVQPCTRGVFLICIRLTISLLRMNNNL